MADCELTRLNLLAYLDGEVTDAERAQIEAHLATCQSCGAELARVQALQTGLRDVVPAGLAQLHLSRATGERIRERLKRQREHRPFLQMLGGLFRPRPGLAKAAIPLLVVLFLVFAGLIGTLPVPVSAQETLVVGPTTLAPDTDAALRVMVRERASAQPIPSAEVSVRLRAQGQREAVLYAGHTDAQGIADVRFHVPAYQDDNLAADLIVATMSVRGQDEVTQRIAVRRSYRVYLTSDKPLYQPGQPLHLRVLALDAARGLPAAGRPILFQVQGVNGERLFEKVVRASGYGIAAADYTLASSSSLGTYRLVAALGDTVSARTVTVGHYERPRFKVDLAASRLYYLAGEVVEGRLTARLLDGRPLPSAQVTLRAGLYDPDRRQIAALQGQTDAQGAFEFRFSLPSPLSSDRPNLALEASVTDAAAGTEWAGRVLAVARQPLAIDVTPEGGRLRPGIENVIYILVTTPDGAPAPAGLTLEVGGQAHVLHTDAYGLAEFPLIPEAGVHDVAVRITAQTANGQRVARSMTLSADAGPAQVLLRLDRATYEVGEAMHIQVLAGQGQVVYLDVIQRSRGQTISTNMVRLRAGRGELSLDVSPGMAGTLELHAYQVLPDGTLVRDSRLAVVDASAQVAVDLRPDRSTYRPGDTAHVALDTRVDGRGESKPVQTAIGIAVVDESVFALEERAPGFAKLFFLLQEPLLDPAAHPSGLTLPSLLDPSRQAEVRAAQDQAARAAWARLPAGDLHVEHSQPGPAAQARPNVWFRWLGWGLAAALLLIPILVWLAVLRRAQSATSRGLVVWRTALALIGLTFVALIPLVVALLTGLVPLLGKALGIVLLIAALAAWLGMLATLGVRAWRSHDDSTQIIVLLVAAYGALGALMGYISERGADPGLGPAIAILVGFMAALAALLWLAAAFCAEKQRTAAGTTFALALLLVVIVVLSGTLFITSSLFARTMTDPRVYAGPAGWLTACQAKTVIVGAEKVVKQTVVVEKEVTKVVKETVEVQKEVTKVVEKEITREVAKEVTKVVEKQVTVVRAPTPTPAAVTSSPTPQATRAPTAQPIASPTAYETALPAATPTPEPPPPLLGQFAPETILWVPEAITDQAGHLELDIALPDVPSVWRLTALASTRNGELGEASARLQAGP